MAKEYSFEDLEVWNLGMGLAECTYKVTAGFPDSEKFGLVSQMRRAAVSIPSNIAEGWGSGRGSAQTNFMRIARGSLHELRTQVDLAARLGFVAKPEAEAVMAQADFLGRKLHAFLSSLESSFVREDCSQYDVAGGCPSANAEWMADTDLRSPNADLAAESPTTNTGDNQCLPSS